ncbi:hypothetical protein GCM10009608_76720 [Pseudonocardia alaniniphila]
MVSVISRPFVCGDLSRPMAALRLDHAGGVHGRVESVKLTGSAMATPGSGTVQRSPVMTFAGGVPWSERAAK